MTMNDPLLVDLLGAAQELLGAICGLEFVGMPNDVRRFENAVGAMQFQTDLLALRTASEIDLLPVPLPEAAAFPILGDGTAVLPAIGEPVFLPPLPTTRREKTDE
jgi:hypothetical protein